VERERGEAAAHLSRIDSDVPEFRQTLSHQQAETLAATLQRRLLDAPKPMKRRYLRGLVSGIILNREKAIVTGPSSAIAATLTSGDFDTPVLTSVREWRTGQDSNSWMVEGNSILNSHFWKLKIFARWHPIEGKNDSRVPHPGATPVAAKRHSTRPVQARLTRRT
jgi:hypothetical protein